MSDILFSINGRIRPEAEALIPAHDRGFLYGDGLFETLHAYGPHLFRLDLHLERLERGLARLSIRNAPPLKTLERWLKEVVHQAGYAEANLRLTVTRGTGPRGPSTRGEFKTTAVIMVTDFHRRPESDYTKGVAAVVAGFRRMESSVTASLKTLNYIEQILARQEADAAGVDEALLLNSAGLLCEGSASNLTLVRDDGLVVPDPAMSGCLPGTVQLVALELAQKLKIPVCQAALGPFDLRDCAEAFLSGSMRELTPLVKVGDAKIGGGNPGPLTRKLIAAYRTLVQKECRGYRFPAK